MRSRPILFALVLSFIPMALAAETMLECFLRCPAGNNSCTQCCSAHGRPTSECRRACFTAACDEFAKCGPHPRCTTECERNASAICRARQEACRAKCDTISIGSVCGGSASKTHKPEKLAARTP